MRGPREWDAATYDRVSGPQQRWAQAVIARLAPVPGERLLDAGCGSGRVSELLLERIGEEGELVCVDASEAMIAEAARRLGDRAELVRSDLLEFRPEAPFDAVFSNATFHWIDDHEALFAAIFGWLRPGGRLEAQCGGEGNVAGFFSALDRVVARPRWAQHLEGTGRGRYFAGAAETEARLRAAGFGQVSCRLEPVAAQPEDLPAFLEAVCLRTQLAELPEELHPAFVAETVAELGDDPVLDYVRLNISARR